MELVVIRHTTVNVPKGICYGNTNVPVSGSFTIEAQNILHQLNNIHFDEIWSSPLERCLKLATFLFKDKQVYTDTRLTELNFGDWEQQNWTDIYNDPYGKRWMDDFINLSCPNGESFSDQINRTSSFYNEIIGNKNLKIALITHCGVIRALNHLLKNVPLTDIFKTDITYGSIHHYSIQNKLN